jgi:hypothetical protein
MTGWYTLGEKAGRTASGESPAPEIGITSRAATGPLDVRVWHFSDMPRQPDDVRSQGQSRHPAARPRLPFSTQSGHHSTLSNVRVAVMVCPVRENVSGGVVIVRFFPLISK